MLQVWFVCEEEERTFCQATAALHPLSSQLSSQPRTRTQTQTLSVLNASVIAKLMKMDLQQRAGVLNCLVVGHSPLSRGYA